MTPRSLEELWADIPPMECKGLCTDSCGPIEVSDAERAKLAARGVKLPDVVDQLTELASVGLARYRCPALVDGRCSVYEVRPTICRLWGSVPEMPCRFGCQPKGGLLSSAAGRRLLEWSFLVGGSVTPVQVAGPRKPV